MRLETVYFRQIVMKTLGKKGGRRQGMTKEAEKKAILAESYYKQGDIAVDKFALEIGVSKMTLQVSKSSHLKLCSSK